MLNNKHEVHDVFVEVFNIVKNSKSIKLPDLQTILFKKYFLRKNNSHFLNEKIVIQAYNRAISKIVNFNDS